MPELQNISGLFQSTEETIEPEVSKINGEIPSWINGIFLRNGPAKWDMDNGKFILSHLFDGYALLSKFTINAKKGIVTYEKKFLESDSYKRGMTAGRPVITEFGTPAYPDPSKPFFSKIISTILPLELSDNNTGAIVQIGDEVFATGETCYLRSINPINLTTPEKFDSNKYFKVNIDSAHPISDDNGTIWNMGSTFLTGLKYNLYRIPVSVSNQSVKELMKKSKIVASIPSSWNGLMSYNHQSFVLTLNYVVFIEQPFVMNIAKAAKSMLKGSPTFSQYVQWRPDLRNRFFIITKDSGKVIKTEIYSETPFFFLHFVNAYEQNNQIIVDLISYENADGLAELCIENIRSEHFRGTSSAANGTVHRYILPLDDIQQLPEGINVVAIKSEAKAIRTGSIIIISPQILTQSGLENPIVNKKRTGHNYNYFYANGTYGHSPYRNSIMKFDLKNRNLDKSWIGTQTQFPGEIQFLQDPNILNSSEDEGILISAVTELNSNANNFLIFINAKTMEEVGRAYFRSHVPPAFHGLFLQDPNTSHASTAVTTRAIG